MEKPIIALSPKRLFILLYVLLFLAVVLLAVRGVVFSDEGYILYGAERIIQGQIPYKDFHFVYTPGSVYLTALSFLIFGTSILSGRILMILVAISAAYMIFRIGKLLHFPDHTICLLILVFVTWGIMHINFPWPVSFCIALGILGCYIFLLGLKKKTLHYFFICGVIVALTFLFKQNFGVALFLTFTFTLLISKQRMKFVLFYMSGLISSISVYGLYLFFSGSMDGFLYDFYNFTVQRIISQGTLTTPFFYEGSVIERSLKTFLYLSPFLISFYGIWLLYKIKRLELLHLCLFPLFFYILGIRPTTDYVHLMPLLSVTSLPLGIILQYEKGDFFRKVIVLSTLLLIIAGLYTALFKGYYKWEPPLIESMNYQSGKMKVFLPMNHSEELLGVRRAVESKSKFIYVNQYAPLWYFLLEKDNPTPLDVIEPTPFYGQYEKIVIENLQSHSVKTIITSKPYQKMFLGEYITRNYRIKKQVNGIAIWSKNE